MARELRRPGALISRDRPRHRELAALVDGHQVSLFRTFDGVLHAIDNLDPFTGAQVLSRGIVGTHGAAPIVASPIFKQVFDLRSGDCLSEPEVAIAGHDARRIDGFVEARLRPDPS